MNTISLGQSEFLTELLMRMLCLCFMQSNVIWGKSVGINRQTLSPFQTQMTVHTEKNGRKRKFLILLVFYLHFSSSIKLNTLVPNPQWIRPYQWGFWHFYQIPMRVTCHQKKTSRTSWNFHIVYHSSIDYYRVRITHDTLSLLVQCHLVWLCIGGTLRDFRYLL